MRSFLRPRLTRLWPILIVAVAATVGGYYLHFRRNSAIRERESAALLRLADSLLVDAGYAPCTLPDSLRPFPKLGVRLICRFSDSTMGSFQVVISQRRISQVHRQFGTGDSAEAQEIVSRLAVRLRAWGVREQSPGVWSIRGARIALGAIRVPDLNPQVPPGWLVLLEGRPAYAVR
jgi:hypothetical protein